MQRVISADPISSNSEESDAFPTRKAMVKTNYENRIRLLRLPSAPCPIACRRSNGLCPPAREVLPIFPNAWRTRPPASDGIRIWPLRVEAPCGCEILRTISEAEDKITRQTPTRLSSPPAPAIRSAKSHTPSPTAGHDGRQSQSAQIAGRRSSRWPPTTRVGATLENIALTIEKKEHILRPFAQDAPDRQADLARLRLPSAARRARLRARRTAPARAGRAPQQGCLSASHGVQSDF